MKRYPTPIVQVQVPEYIMNDMSQVKSIPLVKGMSRPILSDVASFSMDTIPGEYDRAGPRRFVTVSANINKKGFAISNQCGRKINQRIRCTSKRFESGGKKDVQFAD